MFAFFSNILTLFLHEEVGSCLNAWGFSTFPSHLLFQLPLHYVCLGRRRRASQGRPDIVHIYLSYYLVLFETEYVSNTLPPSVSCRITTFSVCLPASSAIERPVILDSILDTVPLSLHLICAEVFQDSHPCRMVGTVDAFEAQIQRPFGILEAVRRRFRSLYLDPAIPIRWLTAIRGSLSIRFHTPTET